MKLNSSGLKQPSCHPLVVTTPPPSFLEIVVLNSLLKIPQGPKNTCIMIIVVLHILIISLVLAVLNSLLIEHPHCKAQTQRDEAKANVLQKRERSDLKGNQNRYMN